MTHPFAGILLNPEGAVKAKPEPVDVKPRAIPETQAVPFASQISAPVGNYVAPEDVRRVMTHEVVSRPSASQIVAPVGENHQQPDTEAKVLASEPGAKPVYLKLKPDTLTPPVNPTSIHITSGIFQTDPTKYSGQFACPIDGSPLVVVGSQHGAWVCQGLGHQWDVVDTAPKSWYVISPTLPQGRVSDPLGNQNL
jgi:hypothetical protein